MDGTGLSGQQPVPVPAAVELALLAAETTLRSTLLIALRLLLKTLEEGLAAAKKLDAPLAWPLLSQPLPSDRLLGAKLLGRPLLSTSLEAGLVGMPLLVEELLADTATEATLLSASLLAGAALDTELLGKLDATRLGPGLLLASGLLGDSLIPDALLGDELLDERLLDDGLLADETLGALELEALAELAEELLDKLLDPPYWLHSGEIQVHWQAPVIAEVPFPVTTVMGNVPGLQGGAVIVISSGEFTRIAVAGVPPSRTETSPKKFVPVTTIVVVPSFWMTLGFRPVTVGAAI